MLQCNIDTTGKEVNIHVSGSFKMIAVNIMQIIRAVYDQTKSSQPDAAEYFRDGLKTMINNDRTWEVDALGTNGKGRAVVVYFPDGDKNEHDT